MKLIIILTILITSNVHAFVSHEDYAITIEMVANKKLTHSRVECRDLGNDGFYSCTLLRLDVGTDEGYEYDYNFVRANLDETNKTVWAKYKVPELYIKRDMRYAKR